MIKLTLTPKTQPITYVFEKSHIVIGRASPDGPQPDLSLPQPSLLPEHVAIEEIDDRFMAINLTNDPFTTINGLPFRKKTLVNGDLIEIQSTCIQFEGSALSAVIDEPIPIPTYQPTIDDLLQRVQELEAALIAAGAMPLPQSKNQGQSNSDLNVEGADSSIEVNYAKPINLKGKSLKDDYLKDLDDENDADPSVKNASSSTPRLVISWKALFTFFICLLLFCSGAFAIFYMSILDRSHKEEIKVAAAVADVVMALNFAQINKALPQNQNWSDPDFLRHNLTAVLAKGYRPLANIDSHGQFHGTSYILRIYTSSDLEHFLVIAQPNPNLLQWLAPKSAILVDSQSMELRKSNDLKILNRLLVDPTLDSNNSAEIAYLVGKGELITFDKLSQYQKDSSFISPKALAFIRPGAENLIYNALRYYHLGESLTKKALALYENRDSDQDISHVMQEIDALMKLKHIVLYTSGGLQTAIAAQKALATFMPQHKFLFAYLQVNSKGLAHGGHLLIDDASPVIATLSPSEEIHHHPLSHRGIRYNEHEKEEALLNSLLPELYQERQEKLEAMESRINNLLQSENETSDFKIKIAHLRSEYDEIAEKYQAKIVRALGLLSLAEISESPNLSRNSDEISEILQKAQTPLQHTAAAPIEQKHPLCYKLAALYDSRQQKLREISSQMAMLMSQEAKGSNPTSLQRVKILDQEYRAADSEIQETIGREVCHLHNTYCHMPLAEFMSYVKASGLESVVQQNLDEAKASHPPVTQEQLSERLAKIQQAESLQALDATVQEISELLTMENVPDTSLLMAYQNAVQSEIIQRLDLFLFSPQQILKSNDLQKQNRAVVERLLKTSWISDEDEIDYYLSEFDLLSENESRSSTSP